MKRGIYCPNCQMHVQKTRVYYTRQRENRTNRIRICERCGTRIPTVERPLFSTNGTNQENTPERVGEEQENPGNGD